LANNERSIVYCWFPRCYGLWVMGSVSKIGRNRRYVKMTKIYKIKADIINPILRNVENYGSIEQLTHEQQKIYKELEQARKTGKYKIIK